MYACILYVLVCLRTCVLLYLGICVLVYLYNWILVYLLYKISPTICHSNNVILIWNNKLTFWIIEAHSTVNCSVVQYYLAQCPAVQNISDYWCKACITHILVLLEYKDIKKKFKVKKIPILLFSVTAPHYTLKQVCTDNNT